MQAFTHSQNWTPFTDCKCWWFHIVKLLKQNLEKSEEVIERLFIDNIECNRNLILN